MAINPLVNNVEQVKKLVERYPYLLPRNVFTDEIPADYDYTYIKHLEIPGGWYKLFFQMCEDIRQPLIEAGCLDTFRFTQIKEKYNELRCYCHGGTDEVHNILQKYEMMAKYVCTICGKPAQYESQSYLASYCDECRNISVALIKQYEPIEFEDRFKITRYKNGKKSTHIISFKDEWDRYIKSI